MFVQVFDVTANDGRRFVWVKRSGLIDDPLEEVGASPQAERNLRSAFDPPMPPIGAANRRVDVRGGDEAVIDEAPRDLLGNRLVRAVDPDVDYLHGFCRG